MQHGSSWEKAIFQAIISEKFPELRKDRSRQLEKSRSSAGIFAADFLARLSVSICKHKALFSPYESVTLIRGASAISADWL